MLEGGLPFPRTHDLLQLLKSCLVVEPRWSVYATMVDGMSDYAVDFRYPGHAANLREARTALRYCRIVRTAVRAALGLRS